MLFTPGCPERDIRGFTLIELIVVVAIAGILLSIAVPAFSGFVLDNRRSTVINDLLASLTYARSEAVSLRQPVSLCHGRSTSGGEPTCELTGGWEAGWLVFIDTNRDGVRNPEEPVIRVHPAISPGITLRGNTKVASAVTFEPHGGTTNNGRIAYCDRRGWSGGGRLLIVAVSGRVRVENASDKGDFGRTGCLR